MPSPAGRFWLPTSQGAEGKAQVMMIRVPVTFEERYDYASVNAPVEVAASIASVPPPPPTQQEIRDSLSKQGLAKPAIDSILRARRSADSAAASARAKARRDSIAARHGVVDIGPGRMLPGDRLA